MYLKLALGNVRRSLKDYSVFFATLAFAACLLYSFSASGDYLDAMVLNPAQRAVMGSQSLGNLMSAFSVFVVIVFAFLVSYGFRFICRRRKKEFALYALLGMESAHVSRILIYEGACVGALSFVVGIGAGLLLSPAFMALEAAVFGVGWVLAPVFSASAFQWTLGCFVALMAVACMASGRVVAKSTPAALLSAEKKPEQLAGASRPALRRLQLAAGVLLVALVWGCVLIEPGLFFGMLLPFGVAALFGTYLLFRSLAQGVPALLRRHPARYLVGLRPFTLRQMEAKASSSAMALAMVCVLLACGLCMMVGGLAFSIGMRLDPSAAAHSGAAGPMMWAPIGFIGLFYGIAFVLSAMAILALQQLSQAADSLSRYRLLKDLGVESKMICGSLKAQLAVYFGMPLVAALVHDMVGMTLVALLAAGAGAAHFWPMVAGTVLCELGLMAVYYLVTYGECRRILLGTNAEERA